MVLVYHKFVVNIRRRSSTKVHLARATQFPLDAPRSPPNQTKKMSIEHTRRRISQTPLAMRPVDRNIWPPLRVFVSKEILNKPIWTPTIQIHHRSTPGDQRRYIETPDMAIRQARNSEANLNPYSLKRSTSEKNINIQTQSMEPQTHPSKVKCL